MVSATAQAIESGKGMQHTQVADIPGLVQDLRTTFKAGRTLPYKWRSVPVVAVVEHHTPLV